MAGPAGDRSLEHKRVLLVEDEWFIADDLAQAIGRIGGEVIGPVATRDDALVRIAASERIDFAVLDVNLRGEEAFPIADALIARGVPFLFATGYQETVLPERYRDYPRAEKPFDPDLLARSLPTLLAEQARRGPQ